MPRAGQFSRKELTMASEPLRAIEQDIACIHCGYNLRALYPDGRCPECGAAIGESLRGDLLKFADAGWLERLAFGIRLKLLNIVLAMLAGVSGMVLINLFPQSAEVIQYFLSVGGGAMGLWASYAITTQEPRISLQEDPVSLRRAIRTCAAVALLAALLPMVRMGGSMDMVLTLVVVLCSVVGYGGALGELIYLSRLALRIPDEPLARDTRRLMWLVVIGGGLYLVIAVFGLAVAGGPTGGAGIGVGVGAGTGMTPLVGGIAVFGCVFAVTALVAFLWYIRLLYKYRVAFRLAAAFARRGAGVAADAAEELPAP